MRELPILFSTPMITSILARRKSMTRRIVKPKYSNTDIVIKELHSGRTRILVERQNDVPPPVVNNNGTTTHKLCAFREILPKYSVGDLLYVREAWGKFYDEGGLYIGYRQDMEEDHPSIKWKPSIHLLKADCRIWLQVTSVIFEKLQDITASDAIAEGIEPVQGIYKDFEEVKPLYRHYTDLKAQGADARSSFKSLWDKINGPESWEENPFVWVTSFKVVSTSGRKGVKDVV